MRFASLATFFFFCSSAHPIHGSPPGVLENRRRGVSHVSYPLWERRSKTTDKKGKKQEGRESLGNIQLTSEMCPRDGRIGNSIKSSIFGFSSTASLTRHRVSSSVRAKADILTPAIESPGVISNSRRRRAISGNTLRR